MRKAGVAALVLFFALATGVGRAGPSGHVLVLNDDVGSISASGSSVAIHVGDGINLCTPAVVWNTSTRAVTQLKDRCTSDGTFQDLTLVAGTAIWWDQSAGNHVYCDDVYANGKALGLCDGSEGDTYYEFAGDRTLAAISDYSVCESDCVDGNGNLLPDGDYGVEVRRLVGGKVVKVLKPVDFRLFLDARSWRMATIEPKDTLTVWDSAGRKLWSRPGVTKVADGWIEGSSVVLHQARALRVYSATGAGVTRPLPRNADVGGVFGGLVVYTVDSTVHLLRLRDGRDRKLVTTKGLVGAQITPSGVFYAAGRSTTLLPMSQALRRLR